MVLLLNSNLEKRIANLVILMLLFLLQNFKQGRRLVHETMSKSLRQQPQQYQQHQHEFLAELYKHKNPIMIVQSSHINTTTTTKQTNNHTTNNTDHSLVEQTTRPTLPNEQQQHEGNHTLNINAASIFSDPFLQQMLLDENKQRRQRLQLSARHQQKFMSQKLYIQKVFPKTALYRTRSGRFAATVLNQKWAYIHIWKSGGTTIEKQTGRGQKRLDDVQIQNRHWTSFVRDPIDHFLSGWAECGIRVGKRNRRPWIASEFDGRIRKHLNDTRTMASNLKFLRSMPIRLDCTRHSFPQANFLLNKHGQIDDKIKVIGDLHEIVDVLKLVGFEYNTKIGKARTAAGDALKRKFFQVKKDLLSNETLWEICNFVAIDYYLFDFQPPQVCNDSMFPGQHRH